MKNVRTEFRRLREGKTDYRLRRNILKGQMPRIVIRKTNKYMIAQVIESHGALDFTKVYVSSKELGKYGWHGSFKNIPAAYLTGELLARKALKAKIKKAVVDIGMQRSTKGNKVYALVKGCKDNGMDINFSEEIAPSDDRIKGRHSKNKDMEKMFNEVKEKISKV